MDYYQLLAEIHLGRIPSVYLFFGEEVYLSQQLLKALEQVVLKNAAWDFNYDLFDGEVTGLEIVLEAASTLPVFADKRLVVVKNAPWFGSGKNKGEAFQQEAESLLLEYLDDPSPSTCLVFFTQGNADKRRKAFKTLAKRGVAWESQVLVGQPLARFIKEWLLANGKRIPTGTLGIILERHQGDLALLVRELEKLTAYLGDKKEIHREDVEAVMVFPEQNSIFELTDAVAAKEKDRALRLLQKMLQAGEAPLYILTMLAYQFRLILYAKVLAEEGYSQSQMVTQMKAKAYPVKKALTQTRYYNKEELIFALEKVLETDVAIKTGQGDPGTLLERAVLELCS